MWCFLKFQFVLWFVMFTLLHYGCCYQESTSCYGLHSLLVSLIYWALCVEALTPLRILSTSCEKLHQLVSLELNVNPTSVVYYARPKVDFLGLLICSINKEAKNSIPQNKPIKKIDKELNRILRGNTNDWEILFKTFNTLNCPGNANQKFMEVYPPPVGVKTGTVTVEISVEVLQKLEIE